MLTIEQIEHAINANSPGSWIPGETPIWRRLSVEDAANGLFGLRVGNKTGQLQSASEDLSVFGAPPLPAKMDWRTERGGRLLAMQDQGLNCGSCVAFATTATVEAVHWINCGIMQKLSEAELFHCNGGDCNLGWALAAGLAAAQKGMVLLTSAPWTDQKVCHDADAVVRVIRYFEQTSINARKQAIVRGPVVGGMKVYEDFSAYTAGVYRHVTGDFRGNHAICIVGYDDEEGCWIARNSWGKDWGEGGYFKIAYADCGIEDIPFYSCETESL